ncbi:DUF421 domain-containing protein [Anaerocaecibacter muris]|uniref:DUF421 domain-containing protein n=1 Tax=Anaerocaecibacter muris TaxID=2941513 RepID=UPI0020401DAA|nr:DUF421 domain-containing protein [Anaerocaecibacter muris]
MFVVFLKSVITFIVVFFVIRLMGKRQLGEMQPFELVITLIIAEVACIPMNDPYIPIYYGLIPIFTLATLHILLSLLSRKSIKARKVLSGSSVIVIDKSGINYANMKKMNMNVDDLIEAVRTAGYVDFSQIAYAIFETNGQLCVVEKEQQQQGQQQDQSENGEQPQTLLPLELVIDGKYIEQNLSLSGTEKSEVERVLDDNGLRLSDLLYADVRQDGNAYFSPKRKPAFCSKLAISGGQNW